MHIGVAVSAALCMLVAYVYYMCSKCILYVYSIGVAVSAALCVIW